MTFTPRSYQQYLLNETRKEFSKGKRRIINQLATGGGKSFLAAMYVYNTLQKDMFANLLVLTHRTKLLDQNSEALKGIGIQPYIFHKDNKDPLNAKAIYTNIQTARRNFKHLPKPTLIVIDECDEGNFRVAFEQWPNAFFVGLTATPITSNKKEPLTKYWDDVICGIDTPELIEKGYLCPAITYRATSEIDESALKKRGGEYTESSQFDAFNQNFVYDNVVEMYQSKAEGLKTIVHCINVEHSLKTAAAFKAKGYKVKSIDSKNTPDNEREYIYDWFRLTEGAILCNCGVATVGFNEPSIECVIVNRKTMSLRLWIQMVGRGSRRNGDKKQEFIVIDMGNNVKQHHLWETKRDWRALFLDQKKKSKKEGVAPVKECVNKKCGALIPANSTICPHCETKQPIKKREKEAMQASKLELVEGVFSIPEKLQKPRSKMSVPELLERAYIGRNGVPYKLGWVIHEVKSRGYNALVEYAELEYKDYKKKYKYPRQWAQKMMEV